MSKTEFTAKRGNTTYYLFPQDDGFVKCVRKNNTEQTTYFPIELFEEMAADMLGKIVSSMILKQRDITSKRR